MIKAVYHGNLFTCLRKSQTKELAPVKVLEISFKRAREPEKQTCPKVVSLEKWRLSMEVYPCN